MYVKAFTLKLPDRPVFFVMFSPRMRFTDEISIMIGGEMQQQERVPLDDSPVAALYQRYAPALFAYL